MKVCDPSVRYSPHGKGFIKVYRKLLSSAVFHDEGTLKVWMWCILRANYEPLPWDFSGEEITVERGTFLTGRLSASVELNMSQSRAWRHLKKLERWGNVSLKSDSRFTVVSINNYETYQAEQDVNRTTNSTTPGQPVVQPADTNKETKKLRSQESSYTDISLEQHLLKLWGREGRMGWGVISSFVDLIKIHGREKVFSAIEEAANHNAKSIAYVKGVLNGNGKNKTETMSPLAQARKAGLQV